MPPRKSYRRRRTVRRRRRFPKRNYARMGKRFDGALGRVFNFRRTVDVPNISYNGNLSFKGFAYSFKLSDIPNFTEISSLFNEVRLMAVALTFYPPINVSSQFSTTYFTVPELYTLFDPTDDAIPSSIDVINQYSNVKRRYFNRPVKRFIKPVRLMTIAQTNEESATTVAKAPMSRRNWLRCSITNSSAVEHFGLRGCIANSNTTSISTPMDVRVTANYYFQCRQLR